MFCKISQSSAKLGFATLHLKRAFEVGNFFKNCNKKSLICTWHTSLVGTIWFCGYRSAWKQ